MSLFIKCPSLFSVVSMVSSSSCRIIKLVLPLKSKVNKKSISEKSIALKEVEKGSSKSQVAMTCGILKNTLATNSFQSHENAREQFKMLDI